jgi:hypothetical protein
VVDVYGALPRVSRVLAGHDPWAEQLPIAWSWGAHLLYGLALGLFYTSVRERLGRGATAQRAL